MIFSHSRDFYAKKETGALGRRRRVCLVAAMIIMAVLGMASVQALDLDDIRLLLDNQVPESVIIDMAAQQGNIGLTESEANELRLSGASENLIAVLGTAYAEPAASDPFTAQSVQPAPQQYVSAPAQPADGSPIMPLEVTASSSFPALYAKEGWLSVSNRDWQPYFLQINVGDKRMFISRHANGGMVVNPGENVVVNIRKEGYKLYGDSGEKLEVKIRENLTTTLSLEPFGVFGNSGLTGVVNDRGKVRSKVLFAPYVPVQTVIVEPAPVVVVPPPARYYYGPPRRYYWYR